MSADALTTRRLDLPLDGTPIDLAPIASVRGGRIRIALEGAVFCAIDGSSFDAFTRRIGDRVVQEDGAFVILPPGSRIVESDPLAHRYLIDIEARPNLPISFSTSKLVSRYLLPRREIAKQLEGAVSVELLSGVPSSAASAAVRDAESSAPAPGLFDEESLGSFVALLALPIPLLLILRRTPEERRKLRHIARAVQAIEAEAQRLGPAFLPVVDAARRVADAALGIGRDAERARSAFRRTAWVESAAAADRRRKVQDREQELVQRLSYLTEQLEVLATELTAVDIDGASTEALAARLAELMRELDGAVAARSEAETVGST